MKKYFLLYTGEMSVRNIQNIGHKEWLNGYFNKVTVDDLTIGDIGFGALSKNVLSAGISSGFTLSDNLDGSVSISNGDCYLRKVDSDTSDMAEFAVVGATALVMTDNDNNYIHIDYNSGSPVIANSLLSTIANQNTIISLYQIYREGLTLYVKNNIQYQNNDNKRIQEFLEAEFGNRRTDGLILGETGLRNPTHTAGNIWTKLNDDVIPAFDASASDTFRQYYVIGASWIQVNGATQWDNINYNNIATGLVAMTALYYSYQEFYVLTDGTVHSSYAQAEYATLAEAEKGPNIPIWLDLAPYAIYMGRLTFQQGSAVVSSIQSAFSTTLDPVASLGDHNFLYNLNDDDHLQYALLVGRTTGQSLIGGTTANKHLTLESTSHVTKGEIRIPEITANSLLELSGTNGMQAVTDLSSRILGTTNQVNVTGTVPLTLSLPQNIHTGAEPTFAGLIATLLATSQVFIDGTTNPRTTTDASLCVDHTSNINGSQGIDFHMHPLTYDDCRCLTSRYDLNASSASINPTVLNLDADITGSSNLHLDYIKLTKIGDTVGSNTLHGIVITEEIDPIHHMSGVLVVPEKAFLFTGSYQDVTTEFGSAGSNVAMFVANGNIVYIGKATTFDEIDVQLAIVASGVGVVPIFEFSEGGSVWNTLPNTDGTNGFRQSGVISYAIPVTWALETVNGSNLYWVRITRNTPAPITVPTESTVKYVSSAIYSWDKNGDLVVNDISCADISMDNLSVDIITEKTPLAGVTIESITMIAGDLVATDVTANGILYTDQINRTSGGSILVNNPMQIVSAKLQNMSTGRICIAGATLQVNSLPTLATMIIGGTNITSIDDGSGGTTIANTNTQATNTGSSVTFADITATSGASIDEFSIDGTLVGNSDTACPTEKAVKTYADTKGVTNLCNAYVGSLIADVTGDNTIYVIIFDTERFDTGSDFNTGTGVYTVPTTGHYSISVAIEMSGVVATTHTGFEIYIVAGGITYLISEDVPQYTGSHMLGGTILASLSATNTIYAEVKINGASKVCDVTTATNIYISKVA